MLRRLLVFTLVLSMAGIGVSSAIAQQFGVGMFPDVLPQSYYFSAVQRFARIGIIKGFSSGIFAPNDTVTRGQVAVILDRYDQEVIAKMRAQITEMRTELGLGVCGDNTVNAGEQCDDGNILNGDGCSAECIREVMCAGGYKLNEQFTAPDGCNVCTCTQAGVACTQRSCVLRKCFSSNECSAGEVCSTEQGDCRFPCPPGAVCIQACAGVCVPGERASQCGNGVCDNGETVVSCSADCAEKGPVCGNGMCEKGESDEYGLSPNGPELLRRGTCAKDCDGAAGTDTTISSDCPNQKKAIDDLFADNVSCSDDTDCAVFVRGCSPYQTCGKAIAADTLPLAQLQIGDYADSCKNEEPSICASCTANTAICQAGKCIVVETLP